MLPSISGLEICRALRRQKETQNIGIIMLTARGEETDRIRGLDSGADDYVSKPFSPSELVARVGALLRRTQPLANNEILTYADIEMDLGKHRARRGQRSLQLCLLYTSPSPRDRG